MTYLQLTKLANTYYDIWTSDGINTFHADRDEISAWLKRKDLRTDSDTALADLTDEEIDRIADMIADMVKENLNSTYYILRDLDGYGSTAPVCVTASEASDLMRGWYAMDANAPSFDEVWREATQSEIAEYGISEN